jgi:hypothetical protein
MALDGGCIASAELMESLLRAEVIRVCNATMESAYSSSPYPTWKSHDEFLAVCKSCNRDTTELSRALNAAKDAVLHLKDVTDTERFSIRKAVDGKRLRAREEDLT